MKEKWIEQSKYLNNPIELKTLGGYSFEDVMLNKNCAKDAKYWVNIKDTERFLFRSSIAESWEFFDADIENPIRNTNQIYLRFLDISEFVTPSNYFRVHKMYTHYAQGTLGYDKYWEEITQKILKGFVIDGVRITGRQYFTINFGRFRAIPVDTYGKATSTRKEWTFLRFIDLQYYLFHELDECLLNGIFSNEDEFLNWFPTLIKDDFIKLKLSNFISTKGRRKGWTAAIATGIFNYNFTFKASSMNILTAYEKAHYTPMLRAIHTTKTFLDKNTPWVRITEILGQYDHFIAGIKTVSIYGIPINEGYLSEVNAISFKDNIFKAIGDSADIINIEEPGKFSQLTEAFPVSFEPLIRDGEMFIGSVIAGGTAGDLEGGSSSGLYEMIYIPEKYGFKSYKNIYEPIETEDKVGWFIDDLWYSPNIMFKDIILKLDDSERTLKLLDKFSKNYIETVDEAGNSYRYFSNLYLELKRNEKRGVSIRSYNKFITQQPKYLSEAFLMDETSPFDIATAQAALGKLISEYDTIPFEKGYFYLEKNESVNKVEVKWKMDLSATIIDEFPWKHENTTGAWVIYEQPSKINGKIPSGRYIGGTDPIDWGSGESTENKKRSLAATYIIDVISRNIVAEYISRPELSEMYYEQLWRGIEYFNAELLYENNLKGLYTHFKMKNKQYLLADEPISLGDKQGYVMSKNSKKGFHATSAINNYARNCINLWTMEDVVEGIDEEGNQILNLRMFKIKSKGLLQEIIKWNIKGNFDRVSGIGAAMIILFDRNPDENILRQAEFDKIKNSSLLNKMKGMMKIHDPKVNFAKSLYNERK